MPVFSFSFSSKSAMYFWLFSDKERSSSSSGEKPSRMYLPSLIFPVPFSFIERSRRSNIGPWSASWAFNFLSATEPAPDKSVLISGIIRRVALRDRRSLGDVELVSMRERMRSKSKTWDNMSSRRDSSVMWVVSSSMPSCRSMMRFTSVNGRSSQRRRSLAPMAVWV